MRILVGYGLPYNCDEAYCEVTHASQDLRFTRGPRASGIDTASGDRNSFTNRNRGTVGAGPACVTACREHAPLTATVAAAGRLSKMDDGWRKVEAGACGVWPLPADATCARVARRWFRRIAGALALDAEAVDDGETMVSELAANTLHAQGNRNDERDRHAE